MHAKKLSVAEHGPVQSLMEDVSFSCEVSRAFLPASFLTVLLSRTTGVVIQLSVCTNLPDVRTFASTVELQQTLWMWGPMYTLFVGSAEKAVSLS